MKTAVEHYNPMPQGLRHDLAEMQTWLAGLPDAEADVHPDRLWSCHAVARAVATAWRLEKDWKIVDGRFAGHYQHSWLEHGPFILDAYPVGSCGGPILLDQHVWRKFYTADPDRFAARRDGFEAEARRLLSLTEGHPCRGADDRSPR